MISETIEKMIFINLGWNLGRNNYTFINKVQRH